MQQNNDLLGLGYRLRKKENLQSQADDLLKEMEALNDAKNSLAKRRVKILE